MRPGGAIKWKVRRTVRPSETNHDGTPSTNGEQARKTIVTPSTGKWIHLTNLFAYRRRRPVPAVGPHYSKLVVEVCPVCQRAVIFPPQIPRMTLTIVLTRLDTQCAFE